MATDYTRRLYWPVRGLEASGEAKTTYGRTIGLTAKLSSAARKDEVNEYENRRNAFQRMISAKIQQKQRNELPPSPRSSDLLPTLSKSSARKNQTQFTDVDITPLDVAIYHGASNDPFVPNTSYKKHATDRIEKEKLVCLSGTAATKTGYDTMLPVHRLYHSSGGYDDTIKAQNHIKAHRPQVIEIAEIRMRQGHGGGVWRHVKEVMQGKGQRIVFVDGSPLIDDLLRVKTNLIQGGVKIPRSAAPKLLPKADQSTSLAEQKGMESGNWRLMR